MNKLDVVAAQESAQAEDKVKMDVSEDADGNVTVIDFTQPPETVQPQGDGAEDDSDDTDDPPAADPGEGADSEGGHTDEAGAAGASGEKTLQERRAEERRAKKAAARQREAQLRRENQELHRQVSETNDRLARLENSHVGTQLAQLDNALSEAQGWAAQFKQARDAAATGNKVAEALDSQDKLTQAQARVAQLTSMKNQMTQATRRQPNGAAPANGEPPAPQIAPAVAKLGKDFMTVNSWYQPNGTDPDTQVVKAIDSAVYSEGFDPSTKEYWAELQKRVNSALPHRAPRGNSGGYTSSSQPQNREKPNRSVVPGGGSQQSVPANGRTFKLSADRVQALKDAGYWDDPAQRADMIRRYMKTDAQASSSRKS